MNCPALNAPALSRRPTNFNPMNNYTEEIKILTQLGTEASQAAIAEYTRYFITNSIVWIVALLIASFLLWLLWKKWANLKDEPEVSIALGIVLGIFSLCCFFGIADSVSDLCNPRAMAIHQLLKDVRGNK